MLDWLSLAILAGAFALLAIARSVQRDSAILQKRLTRAVYPQAISWAAADRASDEWIAHELQEYAAFEERFLEGAQAPVLREAARRLLNRKQVALTGGHSHG